MKKVFLLVAAAIFAGITVNAERRPQSQILSAAAKVIKTNGLRTNSANQKLELKVLDNSFNQFSIVGYNKGSFVIVSNDDAMPVILGYSDAKAEFDKNNMSPAFRWYLSMLNKNIDECLATGSSLPMTKINPEYKSEVPMMCTTEWSQDDPYFRQTPINEENDQHFVTGCVATAMAQAMKYYEYPEIGRGKIKYTSTPDQGNGSVSKLRINFDEEPFDWQNMLDTYYAYKFNDDQADAVAYLMKCTGASVRMTYGASGSGAHTTDAATAFHVFFKYDRSIDCYLKAFFTKDEWCDIAYHAMSDGCPLVFGASSSIQGQDAGHSFVVDGYDKDGLVHVNFGWAGDSNGYYSLLNMHGYDHGFEMIPLRLPQENSPIRSMWGLWNDNVKYSKTSGDFKAQLLNASSRDFTGRIAVVLKNLADGSTQILGYNDYKEEPQVKEGMYYNVITYNASAPLPENLANGDYRLYLASKGSWKIKDDPSDKNSPESVYDEPDWTPVRCPDGMVNSYIVNVTDGNVTLNMDEDPNWITAIDNITVNKSSDIVRVFDVQGRMVYTSKASDFKVSDVPAEGVLIIKNGSEIRKVIK